ncbi:DUF2242 domain-containing protein [Azohydromonas caseinilytica]|uniref:DUF2242 domain-containing protein n=1 Tax=Azohydromonas caseinilytica TaxID=2728836 RepID=A0A848FCL1_9BURK|nr:DUF2242 domain-containing protein [Azohydromonas caseinilytica]NML17214.1 DUF2242 domain-containing protein [Azohydromonas caseinilytica]
MPLSRYSRAVQAIVSAVFLLQLWGCASVKPPSGRLVETFDATDRFARTVAVEPAQACEAARQALLSQGYVVSTVQETEMRGRKNFEVPSGHHVEMEIRVVCTANARPDAERRSNVFVSAVQEHYELKKSSNSASVGVGALGSVSLPFAVGNDSMVKVASETVTVPRFYDRFFEILDRFLETPSKLPSDEVGLGLMPYSEF